MKKFFIKLHLWLSIPVGLVISVICFSGAALVFEKEITRIIDKSSLNNKSERLLPHLRLIL